MSCVFGVSLAGSTELSPFTEKLSNFELLDAYKSLCTSFLYYADQLLSVSTEIHYVSRCYSFLKLIEVIGPWTD